MKTEIIKEFVKAVNDNDWEIVEEYLHESYTFRLIKHDMTLDKDEWMALAQLMMEDTEHNIDIIKIIDLGRYSFAHNRINFIENGQVMGRLAECNLIEWAENKFLSLETYAEVMVKSEITQEWLKSFDMYSDKNN